MLIRSMLALLAWHLAIHNAPARLGETEAQNNKRYGAPIAFMENERVPLLAGAEHRTYDFEGWKIRTALINGRTVRMEFSKRPGHRHGRLISEAEQSAILASETEGGAWQKQPRRFSDYPAVRLDRTGSGTTRYDVWINNNGSRACFKLGKAIFRLESRDALEQEAHAVSSGEKPPEPDRKFTAIPKF